jgi:hypothetical protein
VTPRLPLLLALLAACQGAGPPAPAAPETSVVALAITATSPRKTQGGTAQVVYFVRLAEDVDAARAPELLRSNYTSGGIAYLLDAAPGRYAAVGCFAERDGYHWTGYFPEGLIRATEREVAAGTAVLLGSYDAELRPMSTTGDQAQHHYLKIISPEWEQRSQALKLFTRDEHAWIANWRETGDRDEILARMKKRLGPDWSGRFD